MEEKTNVTERENVQTVPLAYHEVCMERIFRTMKILVIAWAVSIIAAICIFAYMWLQYDYVSTVESSGVYCLTDSAGNVISSDIMPEDIPGILEAIENGNNSANTN